MSTNAEYDADESKMMNDEIIQLRSQLRESEERLRVARSEVEDCYDQLDEMRVLLDKALKTLFITATGGQQEEKNHATK